MFPQNLVLVRHGESEVNAANGRSEKGDHSDFTPEFMKRHNTELRLTNKGRNQAKITGNWLKRNGLTTFDGYYVSEYTRALETAALLDLPGAFWITDFQLREREFGRADIISDKERKERFSEHLRMRDQHKFYARWPDGESMADVCNRLQSNIIRELQEQTNRQVIIVSHGDVMRAFRTIFEHIPANQFHSRDSSYAPYFKIGNGQIIHYTRINPKDPKRVLPYFGWVRSVNPSELSYAGHDWRVINKKMHTNEELLAIVEQSKRLVEQ